jgi:hypothetical protein
MLVHAPNEPGAVLTKDSPIGATWAYPESKVRTEALIRAELRKGFDELIDGTSWETYSVPSLIAKVGAWAKGLWPGAAPFIKPCMIDRAEDNHSI